MSGEVLAERFRELGVGWIHAVPIISGGRLLGVLAAAGHRERPLDERTRRLAAAVADRAGPAMQNAQLLSQPIWMVTHAL